MVTIFLIVHHKGSFRPMQHKVVCKPLLTAVCGRPLFWFSALEVLPTHFSCYSRPVQFARPPLYNATLSKVFHLLYNTLTELSFLLIQGTHGRGLLLCASRHCLKSCTFSVHNIPVYEARCALQQALVAKSLLFCFII
jgi:hypothetical protein